MNKKIKINIQGFGDRFCSNNVEYKINNMFYVFRKKGTKIFHNEYGPAAEWKNGNYRYYINSELHRLKDYAYNSENSKDKQYFVIGRYLGITKKEFIKYLANTLIPINKNWL